jgi:hypothetical protein
MVDIGRVPPNNQGDPLATVVGKMGTEKVCAALMRPWIVASPRDSVSSWPDDTAGTRDPVDNDGWVTPSRLRRNEIEVVFTEVTTGRASPLLVAVISGTTFSPRRPGASPRPATTTLWYSGSNSNDITDTG